MTGPIRLLYRFGPDVTSARRDGDRVTLDVVNWKALGFSAPVPAYADAVMALAGEGTSLSRLTEIAAASGKGAEAVKAVSYYLERFSRPRLLSWTVADDDGELARVTSLASNYRPREDDPPKAALSLCRFAYVRRHKAETVLDSGLVRARAVLNERGVTALARALVGQSGARDDDFAGILWRLGFFDVENPEESDARKCWEFHDLVLHEASRFDRDAAAIGGTYRFDGKNLPPPAIKPAMAGERIVLPVVDPQRVRQGSGALDAVQDRRRSVRTYSQTALSVSTLSEFLWRVCRTKAHVVNQKQDLLSRPYPAGGSINELEFYVAVRRCDGLAPALYHYDSHGHAVVRLEKSDKAAAKIVKMSSTAMGLQPEDQQPDLTIVIASRLPRLAWKYEGMAYRANLMNAGVVFELMYLVATDMGLAPCANGSGESRALQEATGLDRFEEVAIAEFCLGLPA